MNFEDFKMKNENVKKSVDISEKHGIIIHVE